MATATKKRTSTKVKVDLNQKITDQLVALMDSGVAPWQNPFLVNGLALSMSTGKTYRGINPWLLAAAGFTSRWWGTYDQIVALGGQVRKGTDEAPNRSTMVTFWKRTERTVTDEVTGEDEIKKSFMLRYFNVFNAEQADWPNGMPAKFTAERAADFDPIVEADLVVVSYAANGGPTIRHDDQTGAWYAPATDTVNTPNPVNMRGTSAYYSTMFHELTHSTGHKSRLAREGVTGLTSHKRGTVYSFEELVAEFGAAMLCANVGVTDTIDNSAAYLRSWARFLTDDPKAAIRAAGQAQKAVDLILGATFPA